jgi:hypothetical protein
MARPQTLPQKLSLETSKKVQRLIENNVENATQIRALYYEAYGKSDAGAIKLNNYVIKSTEIQEWMKEK